MSKILVTGGAGYIGSHTIVDLINKGFDVLSLDNYGNSDKEVFDRIKKITGKEIHNYCVDLTNLAAVDMVFQENTDIIGIIHFAALKSVEESTRLPLLYFQNNITGLLNLLACTKKYTVNNFIFSSSCSVYGNIASLPVTETTPFGEAESPYARTKQMGEQILQDFAANNSQIKLIALRYFNPAGAHESAIIGESPTNKASNLVPVITEVAIGKRTSMTVFGDDYNTRDGSCVRDYIHVMDLADAHTKGLEYLLKEKNTSNFEVFNLGSGEGATVLEAIRAFEKANQLKLNYTIGPRRAGDVIAVYSDNTNASKALNWQPRRNIEQIMKTAWEWEKARS